MTRKEFFARVGFGAAAILIPTCIGGLASSCSREENEGGTSAPTNVDFTLDISTGTLAVNGGHLVHQGVLVARTTSGTFIAVSAGCTHQGTTVNYSSAGNNFICPNHGAVFNSSGAVTQGPASSNLAQYNTSLNGNSLRIYS